jgi:LuxR family transcriptional regulator, maltose regulon positive regulatory protein
MPARFGVPRCRGVWERKRLFDLLDAHHRQGVATWLSAPGGAGKTSLVASWLRARRRRALWLTLDAGCSDPASFLHGLREAASGLRRPRTPPLPSPEPAHQADIGAFARAFFRALLPLVAGGRVLVLDNWQDLAADTDAARVLCIAVAELLPQVHLVVASRSDPPAALARERLAGHVRVLDWPDLRLTLEESAGLAAKRGTPVPIGARRLAALHAQADGWAAGLVLLLAQPPERRAGIGAQPEAGAGTSTSMAGRELLFDYFASEVIERAGAAERSVLFATAMLPWIDADRAVALSGRADAARVLERLARHNFFTLRRDAGTRPTYEVHALFRVFLVERAQAELGAARWRRLLRSAARLLEAGGDLDAAFDLWRQADDVTALRRFVQRQAEVLLAQGRTQRLLQWIGALDDRSDRHAGVAPSRSARLDCVEGMAWLPHAPERARVAFERAYRAARQAGDRDAATTAWCGAVESLVHERAGGAAALQWIDEFRGLGVDVGSDDADALPPRVTCAMFMLLMWVQPQHPQMPMWLARVRVLLHRATPGAALPTQVSHQYFFYQLLWEADVAGARETLRRLDAGAATTQPLHRAAWLVSAAHLHALTGGLQDCLDAVEEGLRLGAEQGVHTWDLFLLSMPPIAALYAAGDAAAADRHITRLRRAMRPGSVVDELVYHSVLAWRHVHAGAQLRAEHHLRSAVGLSEQAMGAASRASFFPQLWRCGLAQVLARSGRAAEARALMAQVLERRADNYVAPVFLYMADLMEAELQADDDASLPALRSALAFARERGLHQHLGWCPQVMARLYARALDAGIEVDHVRATVTALRLPAPPGCHVDGWPWALELHLLGALEVRVRGRGLAFTSKVQKRPLALLKALAVLPSSAGGGVGEDRLMALLWPGAGRAAAAHALATALYRLRRLLGEEVVLRQGGRLALDAGRCWVDLWALEQVLERVAVAGADAHARQAVARLWPGAAVDADDEPWLADRLDRLRQRVRALTGVPLVGDR